MPKTRSLTAFSVTTYKRANDYGQNISSPTTEYATKWEDPNLQLFVEHTAAIGGSGTARRQSFRLGITIEPGRYDGSENQLVLENLNLGRFKRKNDEWSLTARRSLKISLDTTGNTLHFRYSRKHGIYKFSVTFQYKWMADDLIEILEDFGLYHSTSAPPTTITHAQTPPPPTTNDSIAHSALDATSSTHVTQSRTDAPQTQPTVSTNSLTTPRQRQVELVTLNGPEGPRQYLRDHSNHLTLVDRDIIIQTAMDCPPVPDELLKELLNNPEFVETCRILSAIVHPS